MHFGGVEIIQENKEVFTQNSRRGGEELKVASGELLGTHYVFLTWVV